MSKLARDGECVTSKERVKQLAQAKQARFTLTSDNYFSFISPYYMYILSMVSCAWCDPQLSTNERAEWDYRWGPHSYKKCYYM